MRTTIWHRKLYSVIYLGKKSKKGGNICICIADSLCCIAEINTTMLNAYTPILFLSVLEKAVMANRTSYNNGSVFCVTQHSNH